MRKKLFNDAFDKKICVPVTILVMLGQLLVKHAVSKKFFVFIAWGSFLENKDFLTTLLTERPVAISSVCTAWAASFKNLFGNFLTEIKTVTT